MTFELRTALEEEDDPAVGADIRDLLQGLRTRGDVTVPVARELDALLGVTDVAPAGAAAPPASRRGRVADVATTYSLLVFEFVLAALIALIVLNAGDRCSADGEACGAGAPWTGYGLNALLFVGALVWSLRRLSSRRLAYVVPLAGCLVHFVLLIVVSVVWAR